MTILSSAGWVVHDVGLATAIGGNLFGQTALEPALEVITSPDERDRASTAAWQRFSWVNLASHVAFAVPWVIGRTMLGGREVTSEARTLTRVKDVLIGASLISGIACTVFGRLLGSRAKQGLGPAEMRDRTMQEGEVAKTKSLHGVVNALGVVNLAANVAILGTTALLAMQASKSAKFSIFTRRLP
jgi:hypothetical protein